MDFTRQGPRTKDQKRSFMLKRASRSGDKYSTGGHKKEGANAPRPITLPSINMPMANEKDQRR